MRKLPLYILLLAGAAVFLVPFFWTVSTALKPRQQVYASPPQWVPRTYRINDAGTLRAVNVVERLDEPAAVVRLEAGPRAGQVVPVARSAIVPLGDGIAVRLRSAEPVPARLLRDMPRGLAQVRVQGSEPLRVASGELRDSQLTTRNSQLATDLYIEPHELIPVIDPQWGNFAKAWNPVEKGGTLPLGFPHFVLNTYTITILNIVGQTLSCSLVAYGFARFRFRGRKALFLLLLSTMMLPAQVTMVPVFLIWKKLNLLDTFGPMTIPAFFAQNAFFVFLMRQFFLGIPRELDEAAMIDGAGPLRIWWQIMLPLCKPALTTVAVLGFIAHWDDFMGPLIYLNSLENYTVSLALRLFQDQSSTEFNLLMAAALIHIVPVLLVFFLAQRYFVKGIAMTGLKG